MKLVYWRSEVKLTGGHLTREVRLQNKEILTSFLSASKMRFFSSVRLWLMRALRRFSMMGLVLCTDKRENKVSRETTKQPDQTKLKERKYREIVQLTQFFKDANESS